MKLSKSFKNIQNSQNKQESTIQEYNLVTPFKKHKLNNIKDDNQKQLQSTACKTTCTLEKSIQLSGNTNKNYRQIYSEDNKASKSPFTKSCFSKLRNILTVQQLKEIKTKNSTFRYRTKSNHKKGLSQTFSSRQNKINKQKQQLQIIKLGSYKNQTNLNYQSVNAMMHKKFKKLNKNINNKIPVNILAHSQSIPFKQSNDSSITNSRIILTKNIY